MIFKILFQLLYYLQQTFYVVGTDHFLSVNVYAKLVAVVFIGINIDIGEVAIAFNAIALQCFLHHGISLSVPFQSYFQGTFLVYPEQSGRRFENNAFANEKLVQTAIQREIFRSSDDNPFVLVHQPDLVCYLQC